MYRTLTIATFAFVLLGMPTSMAFYEKVRRVMAEPEYVASFFPPILLFVALVTGQSILSRTITACAVLSAWSLGLGAYYFIFHTGMHPFDGTIVVFILSVCQWSLAVAAVCVAVYDRFFRARHDYAD